MRNKHWLWTALAACAITSLVSFSFIFPATADEILQNSEAIASQSWQALFGGGAHGFSETSSVVFSDGSVSGTDIFASGTDPAAEIGNQDPGSGGAPVPADHSSIFASALPSASPTRIAQSTSGPKTSPSPSPSPSPSASPSPQIPSCTIPASPNLSRKIILNEVAWMGSVAAAGEAAAAAGNREWIELKNISDASVGFAGWQLTDLSGKIKIILNPGAEIAPDGFYLLARGVSTTITSFTPDEIYSGTLANSGDVLAIFDPSCNISDLLNAAAGWPAGNNATKQTLERDASGLGWHTSISPGGTPREENSVIPGAATSVILLPVSAPTPTGTPIPTPLPSASTPLPVPTSSPTPEPTSTPGPTLSPVPVPSPTLTPTPTTAPAPADSPSPMPTGTNSAAPSHLVIAAIAIAGASSTNDFVKIFNPTSVPVDLNGWKLRKKTSTGSEDSLKAFGAGNSVPPGTYFAWANSENGFGDTIAANATSTATLAADNSVALIDASGTIIDALAWGTGAGQFVEGSAYPTAPAANQVLVRRSVGGVIIDTDNNANDFIIQ